MPVATLTFQLPEERAEHEVAINGWRYKSALWEMDQWLRGLSKHGMQGCLNFDPGVVRAKLWELIHQEGLTDLID